MPTSAILPFTIPTDTYYGFFVHGFITDILFSLFLSFLFFNPEPCFKEYGNPIFFGTYGLCLCVPIQEIGNITQGRFTLKSIMRKLLSSSHLHQLLQVPSKTLAMCLHGHSFVNDANIRYYEQNLATLLYLFTGTSNLYFEPL